MRAVAQRVFEASVSVEGKVYGKIEKGLVVFLGAGAGDEKSGAEYLANKIARLRVFDDGEGKMNLSVRDVNGKVLAVPQFTLYGDARRGTRPGFSRALEPTSAKNLFEYFCSCLESSGVLTEKGVFGANMRVHVENDGPVTILLDSEKEF